MTLRRVGLSPGTGSAFPGDGPSSEGLVAGVFFAYCMGLIPQENLDEGKDKKRV